MKKFMHVVLAFCIVMLASISLVSADRGGYGGHGGGHGGGRVGIGVVVGPGWWWPGWWGYPYYPQQPVVIQQSPEIYLQPAPAAKETQYWYFCPDPQGYYPNIAKCPKGWLKVVPPANPPEEEE